MSNIERAARYLFDNRLGWSDGRAPYAPRHFWANLGAALYGESDPRVKELREESAPAVHVRSSTGAEWITRAVRDALNRLAPTKERPE